MSGAETPEKHRDSGNPPSLMGVPGWARWTGASLLICGAFLVSGGWEQQTPELRRPLGEAVPTSLTGYEARDVEISQAEQQVAGMSEYAMRTYEAESPDEDIPWASVYVGYYDTQTQGRTIHSPKNCLPGAGWEALESQRTLIPVPGGFVEVNRYRIQREGEEALVLYWYQGRGRVVASEYRAKWDLLRDATLQRRSDETLVRIVVPVVDSRERALEFARSLASDLKPSLDEALPL